MLTGDEEGLVAYYPFNEGAGSTRALPYQVGCRTLRAKKNKQLINKSIKSHKKSLQKVSNLYIFINHETHHLQKASSMETISRQKPSDCQRCAPGGKNLYY
jgi:hypothetical protein